MKIKALINLVVSANKEVLKGQEYDLNETDAKDLIERGFAEAMQKTQNSTLPKNRSLNKQNASKSQGDNNDDTPPDQSDKQPV